jgi:hypothetical protein
MSCTSSPRTLHLGLLLLGYLLPAATLGEMVFHARKIAMAVSLVLLGCAGHGYTPLPPEQANASYKKSPIEFRTGVGKSPATPLNVTASTALLYLRFFENDKKVAVCGYYVMPESFGNTEEQLFVRLMAGASFYAGETKLVSADFLVARKPGSNEYDAQANCVETDVAIEAARSLGKITIVAPTTKIVM